MARLWLLFRCGTNLIVGILWHESHCWYSVARSPCWDSVARILLLVLRGTNLIVGILWHASQRVLVVTHVWFLCQCVLWISWRGWIETIPIKISNICSNNKLLLFHFPNEDGAGKKLEFSIRKYGFRFSGAWKSDVFAWAVPVLGKDACFAS